jgi:hypothetical protein
MIYRNRHYGGMVTVKEGGDIYRLISLPLYLPEYISFAFAAGV